MGRGWDMKRDAGKRRRQEIVPALEAVEARVFEGFLLCKRLYLDSF